MSSVNTPAVAPTTKTYTLGAAYKAMNNFGKCEKNGSVASCQQINLPPSDMPTRFHELVYAKQHVEFVENEGFLQVKIHPNKINAGHSTLPIPIQKIVITQSESQEQEANPAFPQVENQVVNNNSPADPPATKQDMANNAGVATADPQAANPAKKNNSVVNQAKNTKSPAKPLPYTVIADLNIHTLADILSGEASILSETTTYTINGKIIKAKVKITKAPPETTLSVETLQISQVQAAPANVAANALAQAAAPAPQEAQAVAQTPANAQAAAQAQAATPAQAAANAPEEREVTLLVLFNYNEAETTSKIALTKAKETPFSTHHQEFVPTTSMQNKLPLICILEEDKEENKETGMTVQNAGGMKLIATKDRIKLGKRNHIIYLKQTPSRKVKVVKLNGKVVPLTTVKKMHINYK